MVKENNIDIETKIIEAANKVFLQYGIDGSTMLQIADEAEISRTSLHYYFRDKAHLFKKVLESIQDKIIPKISVIIDEDTSLFNKIEMFINEYIDLIMKNPMIPRFISMQLQSDPSWVISIFKSQRLHLDKLNAQIEREIEEKKINSFKLEELLANIIGMSVFPLLSKALFMEFIFDKSEKEFYDYMKSHKKSIMYIVRAWLSPD